MLSILTQTAIAVLRDISLGNELQSVNFLLSGEEWEDLFLKQEAGRLIRRLADREPGVPASYELCRPLSEISLLDVLEATDEPVRCNTPTPETFYLHHGRMARKIGVLNRVARMFLADIKISEW